MIRNSIKILLIFLIVGYWKLVNTIQLPVCCPIAYDLMISDQCECINLNNNNNNNNNNSNILNDFFSIEPMQTDFIYGYQIMQVNQSAIPKCNKHILLKFNDDAQIELSANSCLTKILNQYYAITCPTLNYENNEPIYQLNIVEKCCEFNEFYDIERNQCAPLTKNFDLNFHHFNEIFHSPYIFSNSNPLNCADDDVMVQYTTDNYQFSFHDSKLRVGKDGSNTEYEIGSYCFEAIGPITTANGSLELIVTTEDNPKDNLLLPYRTNVGQQNFMARTCNRASICNKLPCIRRCCGEREKYMRVSHPPQCIPDNSDLEVNFHQIFNENGQVVGKPHQPEAFGIFHKLDCQKYRLDVDVEEADEHYILSKDGSLYFYLTNLTYTNSEYCVEKVDRLSGEQMIYTFLCFEEDIDQHFVFSFYSVGLLISSGFFALTLIVYMCIPKLRNLPGKILISLVVNLMVAYLGIAIGQIAPPSKDNICYGFAFFIYFSLMAAFAWMNVMCFDIWLTFGSSENSHGFRRGHMKRFLCYSVYGWGLPCFLTTVTILLTKYSFLNEEYRPKFANGSCWFQHVEAKAQLLFFLAPVGILFFINFVLFLLTLKYCNKVKREIFRMQSSNMAKPVLKRRFFVDKAQFMMNTKLFIVMGITWFLEILSTFFYDRKRHFFWMISDSFNVLEGVLVFFIYVFKWRVWEAIKAKFGVNRTVPTRLGVPSSATNSTSVNMMRLRSVDATSLNTSLLNVRTPNRLSPNL